MNKHKDNLDDQLYKECSDFFKRVKESRQDFGQAEGEI